MEAVQREQPLLDGWGASGPFYDHQFMGFDKAPYGTHYLPAQPMGPYLNGLESLPQGSDDNLSNVYSSDDEDDRKQDTLDSCAHISLSKVLGKQIVVWSHRAPDTLAIFTPIPGDTLSTAVSFARSTLNYDPSMDHVLVLMPGAKKPVRPSTVQKVKIGTSLMVVPRYDYVIVLDVTQLGVKINMAVKVTTTVRNVKARLQRERGFPMERVDLLFRDQPMENQRHLFDYRITQDSTLYVLLQLVYDVRVTVETFWGINYQLYVDHCMTTAGLLTTVLSRTVSREERDVSGYFHLNLPRHAVVVYSNDGVPMKWSACLGLYGLEDGTTLRLSTIALAHEMNVQKIPVLLEDGLLHTFLVSKFDYWSVLALKLHGYKGYPVNLIRLFCGKRELDFATAVGSYSHKTPTVRLDISRMRSDKDLLHGVSLNFRLGNGITETLICSPTRTIKFVKKALEAIGVPNATVYDLFIDGYCLPNSGRIADVVEEYKKPIDLKLRRYPIFVHAPNSVIYKMNAHAQEALKIFKARVQAKTGLSETDYYLLMAGLPLADSDDRPVFRTPLAIGSSVFLMGLQQQQTFLVVWDDWLVKVRLPFHPQPSEIKDLLWKNRDVPEGSLASVANFLQWYFSSYKEEAGFEVDRGDNDKGKTVRQSRQKKRRGRNDDLWLYNALQMQQLHTALEKRHTRQRNSDHQRRQRTVPQGKIKPRREEQGIIYVTNKDGRLKKIQPEVLVENYLRALSLPSDVGIAAKRDIAVKPRHRKSYSAIPGIDRKLNNGADQTHKKADPRWIYSLQKLARGEKVEPAIVGLTKKRKPRKHRRPRS